MKDSVTLAEKILYSTLEEQAVMLQQFYVSQDAALKPLFVEPDQQQEDTHKPTSAQKLKKIKGTGLCTIPCHYDYTKKTTKYTERKKIYKHFKIDKIQVNECVEE